MPAMSDRLKQQIRASAAEIGRLHARIDETFSARDKGRDEWKEWEAACREFHARFDELAFPGGYSGAAERLLSGDADTVEATLSFLELRPYFFRSGYMFSSLLRKAKRAPLSGQQAERLAVVLDSYSQWREKKLASRGHNYSLKRTNQSLRD